VSTEGIPIENTLFLSATMMFRSIYSSPAVVNKGGCVDWVRAGDGVLSVSSVNGEKVLIETSGWMHDSIITKHSKAASKAREEKILSMTQSPV